MFGLARRAAREMDELRASAAGPPRPIDRAHVASLPPPVRRWAEVALVGRETLPRWARVRQAGWFRTKLDGPWLPLRGAQLFSFDPPGFVWWGRVRMAPGVWIDARDRSVDGAGHMLVKLESLVTVADVRGRELDESALHRLLGEMGWFTAPLLDPRWVRWSPVDDRSARATLVVSGVEVSAIFEMGDDGLPAAFRAERWRDVGGGRSERTPFTGTSAQPFESGGVRVPRDVRAFWHVGGEAKEYGRFRLESVEFG
jgi:hypothetical protein